MFKTYAAYAVNMTLKRPPLSYRFFILSKDR